MLKKDTHTCPYCDAEELEFLGYDDGGGDYGDMITATYVCNACGSHVDQGELDWIETEDAE